MAAAICSLALPNNSARFITVLAPLFRVLDDIALVGRYTQLPPPRRQQPELVHAANRWWICRQIQLDWPPGTPRQIPRPECSSRLRANDFVRPISYLARRARRPHPRAQSTYLRCLERYIPLQFPYDERTPDAGHMRL